MATVTFTIPDAIVTELNQIAVKAGFANAKEMTKAYLTATVRADRERKQRDALPPIATGDVTIS